ncbi:MAG TPA: C4-type zinc ribbon domain-containing protein [Candidatus Syntrophosphaera thermopropionivorans]|jgi:predicted  nucleic acid-binding Zn-ribbon protein|nr:hypothetical protein [Candidatus Syntrophosphaera sp.]HNZ44447.1 C4-type zinc ribbon domain-containing protein [Candidatus Syntrophosphaera thermopropionivorans]HOH82607.1 C4-type zinc ribbon domain-containing protein [Candidatus Syntrophosphaera thermopropionivorans]HOL34196.1 C4-type zinc ribbon domain-containing protein [Candidatus Syntrophosphaera thermopropionivorans]HON33154.1 C4-type zinc ribbon domain-containing protein [Candidatus Syntrophosphaera thermopropionivorans]
MEEQLRTLAQMQKLDDKIGALRQLQNELPKELNDILANVEQAEANLNTIKNEMEEITKKLRSIELDIKQYQENIKKYAQQLADIKTNKEYKALNSEIAYLKEKISELESQELELMEEESECKEKMEKAKTELEEAKKIQQERENELRKKIASLDGDIEHLRAERNKLAQTLPQSLVKQYAKLLKYKNNCAVAYARNGACGACGFVIRPQVRIEIQQRNKINYCENCGRILMEKFEDL